MLVQKFVFRHRISAAVVGLMSAMPVPALAGEFNETDGVAIKGFDPVAYVTERAAVPGRAEFSSVYGGSTFHFRDAGNRDAFIANPAKYAPQYGGYCAYGVARGYKAATTPEAFSVIDGKLYLNYNAEVNTLWSKNIPGFIDKANLQWPMVARATKVSR